MDQKTDFPTLFFLDNYIDSPKVSEILDTCDQSKNLMISIYVIKIDQFLYCNKVFENIIGYTPRKLFEEGWDFWFSRINANESLLVEKKIKNFMSSSLNEGYLMLHYHFNNFYGDCICLKHEIYIFKLGKDKIALNYFFDVSEKEKINQCIKVDSNYGDFGSSKKLTMNISSREKEVLQLISNGFTSKQIANKLFISNHTAITHRKNLIEKFNVKNTAQLIKEASKVLVL